MKNCSTRRFDRGTFLKLEFNFFRYRFRFQTCFSSRGCGLRTPDVHRRESLGSPAGFWPRCNPGTGLPSPCDCRLSTDLYSSRYRGSLTSIPSPGLEVVSGPSRRHSWRATAASFDTWRVPAATSTPRPTWSSMPSSPTHVHPPTTSSKTSKNLPKRTRSKVTFQGTLLSSFVSCRMFDHVGDHWNEQLTTYRSVHGVTVNRKVPINENKSYSRHIGAIYVTTIK